MANNAGTINLDYFYGIQSEMFSFLRIPKILIKDGRFEHMSNEAKMLFGLLLDRMSLSMKNRWFDDEDRVYIIYTKDEIMIDLCIGSEKCAKLLKELETFGLIERKRVGLSKPNIIYVKNFATLIDDGNEQPKEIEKKIRERKDKANNEKNQQNDGGETQEKSASNPVNITEVRKSNFKKFGNRTSRSSEIELQEIRKSNFKEFENRTSRDSEIELQEVRKSNSNNTNINNTDYSNTDISDTDSLTHSLTQYEDDMTERESEGDDIYTIIDKGEMYQRKLAEQAIMLQDYKAGKIRERPQFDYHLTFENGDNIQLITYRLFEESRKKYGWSQTQAINIAKKLFEVRLETVMLKATKSIDYYEDTLADMLISYMAEVVGLNESLVIKGTTLSPEYMGNKFFEIGGEEFGHLIRTLRDMSPGAKNKKNYYIACLLNAKDHMVATTYEDLKTI